MSMSSKNHTAVHVEKEGVIFEVDGETFWSSKSQVTFPRYGIRNGRKETIAPNWRDLLRDFPVICAQTRFSEKLGRDVIEVNLNDANLRYYEPIERLRCLREEEKHEFYTQISCLCNALECIGLDANGFGIRGSLLVGQQNEFSDIDLLIYGHKNKEALFSNFTDFYQDSHISNILKNEAITQELYARRHDHFSGIDYEYFLLHERRRMQGIVNDKTRFVFSIIGEAVEDTSTKTITPVCPASVVGKVINNSDTFYDPAHIRLELRDLLASGKDQNTRDAIEKARGNKAFDVTVYGDPICAVAFFPGDTLRIRGFLEKTEAASGEESYKLAIRPADDCTKQIKLIKDIGIRLW
ncbi:MAG: hypothetical protein M1286_03695 [Candidatus Marsarchaeota archaeon]|nr:hypothetical protein [Candidatus Marsarchaeota archaeon]